VEHEALCRGVFSMKIWLKDLNESHISSIIEIEQLCFRDPWREQYIRETVMRSTVTAKVAEFGKDVVGWVVFEQLPHGLVQICTVGVHPERRREGIGTFLLFAAIDLLRTKKLSHLMADCRESNTAGHLFLAANEFVAVRIIREFYTDTGEDAFCFDYWEQDRPVNRIAKYLQAQEKKDVGHQG